MCVIWVWANVGFGGKGFNMIYIDFIVIYIDFTVKHKMFVVIYRDFMVISRWFYDDKEGCHDFIGVHQGFSMGIQWFPNKNGCFLSHGGTVPQ